MALRKLRTDDDPILRKRSKNVTTFDQKLEDLVDDMKESLIASEGVGLSAVQVGVLKRVILAYPEEDILVYVNPEITASYGHQIDCEGCLSLPGITGEVERPMEIELTYQSLDGTRKKERIQGFHARIMCHEIDHLDGILFTDRAKEGTVHKIVDQQP